MSLPSRSPTARLPGAYGENAYCEPASSAAIQYASCDTWTRESSTWQGLRRRAGTREHRARGLPPHVLRATYHRLDYGLPCRPTCCARRPRICPPVPRGYAPVVVSSSRIPQNSFDTTARQRRCIGNAVRACRVLSTAKSEDSMRCAAFQDDTDGADVSSAK